MYIFGGNLILHTTCDVTFILAVIDSWVVVRVLLTTIAAAVDFLVRVSPDVDGRQDRALALPGKEHPIAETGLLSRRDGSSQPSGRIWP